MKFATIVVISCLAVTSASAQQPPPPAQGQQPGQGRQDQARRVTRQGNWAGNLVGDSRVRTAAPVRPAISSGTWKTSSGPTIPLANTGPKAVTCLLDGRRPSVPSAGDRGRLNVDATPFVGPGRLS